MFLSRKHKTVASIMESFRDTIADLQKIIEIESGKNIILNERRTALGTAIETNDTEIQQARGVEGRLNDLVFGPDTSIEEIT